MAVACLFAISPYKMLYLITTFRSQRTIRPCETDKVNDMTDNETTIMFACDTCGRKYSKRDSLGAHIRRTHKGREAVSGPIREDRAGNLPPWYFSPAAVKPMELWKWLSSLDNTARNRGFVRTFLEDFKEEVNTYETMSEGGTTEDRDTGIFNSMIDVENLIIQKLCQAKTPFYIPFVAKIARTVYQDWKEYRSWPERAKEVKGLQEQIDRLKREKEELEPAGRKAEELRSTLRRLEDERAEKGSHVSELRKEEEELSAAVSSLSERLSSLQASAKENETLIENAAAEVSELEKRKKILLRTVQDLEDKCDELQADVAKKRKVLSILTERAPVEAGGAQPVKV